MAQYGPSLTTPATSGGKPAPPSAEQMAARAGLLAVSAPHFAPAASKAIQTETPFWAKVLNLLDVPRQAISDALFDGDEHFIRNWFNKEVTGDDWGSKVLRGVGTFVGEVATDPLTYVTFGAGGLAKGVAKETVVKTVMDKTAGDIAEKLGAKGAKTLAELAERKGLTAVELVDATPELAQAAARVTKNASDPLLSTMFKSLDDAEFAALPQHIQKMSGIKIGNPFKPGTGLTVVGRGKTSPIASGIGEFLYKTPGAKTAVRSITKGKYALKSGWSGYLANAAWDASRVAVKADRDGAEHLLRESVRVFGKGEEGGKRFLAALDTKGVRDALDNNLPLPAGVALDDAQAELLRKWHKYTDELFDEMGNYAENVGYLADLFPRVVSAEGNALRFGSDEVIGPTVRAKYGSMWHQRKLKDMSVDEANDFIFKQTGVKDFYTTDPWEALAKWTHRVTDDIALHKYTNELTNLGINLGDLRYIETDEGRILNKHITRAGFKDYAEARNVAYRASTPSVTKPVTAEELTKLDRLPEEARKFVTMDAAIQGNKRVASVVNQQGRVLKQDQKTRVLETKRVAAAVKLDEIDDLRKANTAQQLASSQRLKQATVDEAETRAERQAFEAEVSGSIDRTVLYEQGDRVAVAMSAQQTAFNKRRLGELKQRAKDHIKERQVELAHAKKLREQQTKLTERFKKQQAEVKRLANQVDQAALKLKDEADTLDYYQSGFNKKGEPWGDINEHVRVRPAKLPPEFATEPLVVYHHATSAANAESILKNGLNEDSWLAPAYQSAATYQGDGVVLSVLLPESWAQRLKRNPGYLENEVQADRLIPPQAISKSKGPEVVEANAVDEYPAYYREKYPTQEAKVREAAAGKTSRYTTEAEPKLRTPMGIPEGYKEVRGTRLAVLEGVVVPTALADDIISNFHKVSPTQIGQSYDSFVRVMKRWVTIPWPGFHVRNAFGGYFNNWIGGVRNKHYFHVGRILDDLSGKGTSVFRGQLMSDEEALALYGLSRQELEEGIRGLVDSSLLAEFTPKQMSNLGKRLGVVKTASEKYMGAATSVMQGTEEALRGAAFLRGLELSGGDVPFARSFALQRHGNYSELTAFEEQARRVVPFYKWARTNIPFQFQQLLENPGRVAAANRFIGIGEDKELTDELESQGLLPDFIRERGGYAIGRGKTGNPLTLTPDSPFTDIDIAGVLGGDLTGSLEKALNMLSPPLKLIAELGLEKNMFTGADLREMKPAKGPVGTLAKLFEHTPLLSRLTVRTPGGEIRMTPKLYSIFSALPSSRMQAFIGDIQTGNLNGVTSALLGIRTDTLSPEDQEIQLWVRNKALEFQEQEARKAGFGDILRESAEASGLTVDGSPRKERTSTYPSFAYPLGANYAA